MFEKYFNERMFVDMFEKYFNKINLERIIKELIYQRINFKIINLCFVMKLTNIQNN